MAETVEVRTRRAGDPLDSATLWRSNGESEYSIETINKADRGTSVTLFLKEEEAEFAESFRLKSIVKRYAEHLSLPVKMLKENYDSSEEDNEDSEPPSPEYEAVNDAKALWTKSRSRSER